MHPNGKATRRRNAREQRSLRSLKAHRFRSGDLRQTEPTGPQMDKRHPPTEPQGTYGSPKFEALPGPLPSRMEESEGREFKIPSGPFHARDLLVGVLNLEGIPSLSFLFILSEISRAIFLPAAFIVSSICR